MILCLDIAFANMGWSAVYKGTPVGFGTIRTEKDKRKQTRVSDDNMHRAGMLSEGLIEILKHNHEIKGIIGEVPHGSQNAVAAKLLGFACGVVSGVAAASGIPCEWVSEGDSKKAAIGKRSGTKEEMMDWCRRQWPEIKFPTAKTHFEHVADSLAAYHALRNGVLVRAFG